jgi:hypothetical protein
MREINAVAWDKVVTFGQAFAKRLYQTACPALTSVQRRAYGVALSFELQLLAPQHRLGDGISNLREQVEFLLREDLWGADDDPQPDDLHAPEWMGEVAWTNLGRLERAFVAFEGLRRDICGQLEPEWKTWFRATSPDMSVLPGEWKHLPPGLPICLIICCCRSDRLQIALDAWVTKRLGNFKHQDNGAALRTAAAKPPCCPIFIVQHDVSGVLPPLRSLAQTIAKRPLIEHTLDSVNGFDEVVRSVEEAADMGRWVLLHDAHLAPNLMRSLTTAILRLNPNRVHSNFHLWITTRPSTYIPSALNGNSVQIAIEEATTFTDQFTLAQQIVHQPLEKLSRVEADEAQEEARLSELAARVPLAILHTALMQRQQFVKGSMMAIDEDHLNLAQQMLDRVEAAFGVMPAEVVHGVLRDAVYAPGYATDADAESTGAIIARILAQDFSSIDRIDECAHPIHELEGEIRKVLVEVLELSACTYEQASCANAMGVLKLVRNLMLGDNAVASGRKANGE